MVIMKDLFSAVLWQVICIWKFDTFIGLWSFSSSAVALAGHLHTLYQVEDLGAEVALKVTLKTYTRKKKKKII